MGQIKNSIIEEEDKATAEGLRRFLNGEQWSCSTFIDEVTTTYGYGKLDELGCWEFPLPKAVVALLEECGKFKLYTRILCECLDHISDDQCFILCSKTLGDMREESGAERKGI